MKNYLFVLIILISQNIFAESGLAPLTVQKIMRDEKWIGTSPSNPRWSSDSRYLFFEWNPEKAVSDSVYYISREYGAEKLSAQFLDRYLMQITFHTIAAEAHIHSVKMAIYI